MRPKVSGVVRSLSFAGNAERLAGITRSNDVYPLTKWTAIEGLNIRPDRSDIQLTRFNLCDQVRASEGFYLHVADRSKSRDNSFDSQFESSVSRTQTDTSKFFGIIHIR